MEARPMDGILKKVSEICPAAVQGDKIDFERLKEELDPALIDKNESYNFTWVGKRDAIMGAASPIRKTLRPCKDESKNWDTTKNLYIEGDNLDVLKLLQESYLGKVKMIYIDPPYNTGNDFIYCDDFADNCKEYLEKKGQCDIETNERLFKNDESNGRYHSNWCSMMYPRLKVARDLLSDDGVIFISIDDNEQANLKKICDEIFGEDNIIPNFIIESDANKSGENVLIQSQYEYVLVYAKNKEKCFINKIDPVNSDDIRALNDAPTPLLSSPGSGYSIYYNPITGDIVPKMDYDKTKIKLNTIADVYIDDENLKKQGYIIIRPGFRNGNLQRWRWSYETFLDRKSEIIITASKNGYKVGFRQIGFNTPGNIWNVSSGTVELKQLFNKKVFDNPKSITLLDRLLKILTDDSSIIIDFFSGSATTAHAVMQLNAEDGGNRRFIMVQLPENLDENLKHVTDAAKDTIENAIALCDELGVEHKLTEVAKERIRRAGDKIVQDTGKSDLDIGFKVLKLDDTNMKDVYYTPAQTTQAGLLDNVDNIKTDRTPLDLLYSVMLDLGLTLDLDIQEVKSGNVIYFNVDKGSLIACFETNIPDSVIKEIANAKPLQVVFRDSCFADAPSKINVTEIFKTISPATKITVL